VTRNDDDDDNNNNNNNNNACNMPHILKIQYFAGLCLLIKYDIYERQTIQNQLNGMDRTEC
jgi:hypothetical protein